MPEEQRSEIAFFSLQTSREVQGNTKDGRRPYIQYENVRYTNEILARSPGLIGTKIDIMVNVDDLRVIRAYLPDGSELGKLKAKGKWGIVPHSLQIRKEIYRLKNDKLIHFTLTDDPIAIYNRYLMENIKIKRNANKYKENQRNHERNINTENIESTHTIPEETGKVDSEQPPVLSLPVQQQVTRRTLRKTIIY
jgi:hypothetical protein